MGDRIQLQQVILNLMMNGIEAMAGIEGRMRQLLIQSRVWNDGQVCISIEDSGIGVSAEMLPRLFEPFYTTRFYTTRSQGIGMGLPISRSIIEAHGGRLWAESTVNKGSVFQFTLSSGEASSE
jgi:signal transduction histidine kinase